MLKYDYRDSSGEILQSVLTTAMELRDNIDVDNKKTAKIRKQMVENETQYDTAAGGVEYAGADVGAAPDSQPDI